MKMAGEIPIEGSPANAPGTKTVLAQGAGKVLIKREPGSDTGGYPVPAKTSLLAKADAESAKLQDGVKWSSETDSHNRPGFQRPTSLAAPVPPVPPAPAPGPPKVEDWVCDECGRLNPGRKVRCPKPCYRWKGGRKGSHSTISRPPPPPPPQVSELKIISKRRSKGPYNSRSGAPSAGSRPATFQDQMVRRPKKVQPAAPHYCPSCEGAKCALCDRGCLSLEPSLLICNGAGCHGSKIRKGAIFHAAKDGTKQWCQKCYANLPAIIPDEQDAALGLPGNYKRDLLKRRNDEEVVERWVKCTKCQKNMHAVCAMFNGLVSEKSTFVCVKCVAGNVDKMPSMSTEDEDLGSSVRFSFVAGSEVIKKMPFDPRNCKFTAESLPRCAISSFIEKKTQQRMVELGCPSNAEKTLLVRVISDYEKDFHVPDVIRRHFRMETVDDDEGASTDEVSDREESAAVIRREPAFPSKRKRRRTLMRSSSSLGIGGTPFIAPPSLVKYHSKAITLFQRIDGVDVCVFCMYVQEYDGDDRIESDADVVMQKKRVYIAYLDSVEHFRPRMCRTEVYHEILVAYLASARARGYETAHIWACPPIRGNSFVFWSHPSSQKTPTRDRLTAWYHNSLSRAVKCGVVNDVTSLYEHSFKKYDKSRITAPFADGHSVSGEETCRLRTTDETLMVCPPLLDGDMWIEEAVRLHSVSVTRHLKSRSTSMSKPAPPPLPSPNCSSTTEETMEATPVAIAHVALPQGRCCPALQTAKVLLHRVMMHPCADPFRRPVNASALNLRDYHSIIKKPMDLGTVHSRLLLGEFHTLNDLVSEAELVFRNAKQYNSKGHFVYTMAIEARALFVKELNKLADLWTEIGVECPGVVNVPTDSDDTDAWKLYGSMSMRLSTFLDIPAPKIPFDAKAKSKGVHNSSDAKSDGESKDAVVIVHPPDNSGSSTSSLVRSVEAEMGGRIDTNAPQVIPPDTDVPSADEVSSASTEPRLEEDCPGGKKSANEARSNLSVSIDESDSAPSTANLPAEDASSDSPSKRPREEDEGQAMGNPNPPSKVTKHHRRPIQTVKSKSVFGMKSKARPVLNLLTDGPDAVAQRMVGEDYWLFDKNTGIGGKAGKAKKKKRSKSVIKAAVDSEFSAKKRRESWLGDEVGAAIRRMRRDFFVCNLTACEEGSNNAAQSAAYAAGFDHSYEHGCAALKNSGLVSPGIADARHGLLEFLQYRNFQFDTLRRAKHSTAMLLFYVHNPDAAGLVPVCSKCSKCILHIRWHRIKRPAEERRRNSVGGFAKSSTVPIGANGGSTAGKTDLRNDTELCQVCYDKTPAKMKDHYIPIRVTFENTGAQG